MKLEQVLYELYNTVTLPYAIDAWVGAIIHRLTRRQGYIIANKENRIELQRAQGNFLTCHTRAIHS